MVGAGLIVVGGAAGVAGWVWSRNHLTPWLSSELSKVVDRPVELGPLERLGPTGLRVGVSTMPPTTTDPDTLSVGAIEVRLNPLDVLRRDVRLMVNLEQVEAYVEQAADGKWVAVELDLPEPKPDRTPIFEVSVGAVRLQDSQVTLVPYGTGKSDRPQIILTDLQGQGDFSNVDLEVSPEGEFAKPRQSQRIDFTLEGDSVQGGSVALKGAVQLPPAEPKGAETSAQTIPPIIPELPGWLSADWLKGLGLPASPAWAATVGPFRADGTLQGRVNLRAQTLRSTDIMPLVESFLDGPLPVQFPTGQVSGSVDMEIGGEESPRFTGTARVSDASVTGSTLPQPLQDLQGDVRFQGQTLQFEAVTARMGELSAKAGGTLDFKAGYDLSGQIKPFTVTQAADLLETSLPVDASGTFIANVAMTGPLAKPVIDAELVSQDQVTIDQVAFSEVRARGTLKAPVLAIDQLLAVPLAGGSLSGSGQFTLGQPGQLSLALTGDRLPADALGQAYGLSDAVTLGPLSFDARVTGPVNQLTGTASWRAPAGDYPARGDIRLANNTLRFTDTFVQVAGGTLVGQGELAKGQWNADVRARGIQLSQLGAGVSGEANGAARFSGSLQNPGLAGIQGQGTGAIALASGTVLTQATLDRGRWSADLRGENLQLRALAPDLQGTASGQFRFMGTTGNLSLAGTRGQGRLVLSDGLATIAPRAPQLAQVQDRLTADLDWNGQAVLVRQASTAGLQVNGSVTPQFEGVGGPGIANLDLNLNVDGFSLAALPVPEVIPLQGNVFFNGRLRGRPGALALNGEAALVGLMAGELAFTSPLTGPVTFSQGGALAVNLTGSGDSRIYVATAQGDRDLEFELINDFADPARPNAVATGYIQGEDLTATIQNLPLTDLKLPQGGLEGIGTVGGTITTARVVANLRQPTLDATFDIADPRIGYLRLPSETLTATAAPIPLGRLPGIENLCRPSQSSAIPAASPPVDQPAPPVAPTEEVRYGHLKGQVFYGNQRVTLRNVALESASGLSRYRANGTYTLADEPQLNGKLEVDNGQIQDILTTLLIFEQADFRPNLLQPPAWFRPATAADVASLEQVKPVGDRNASLLTQLRRLAEVCELQDILAASAEESAFPPLEEFKGSFSGNVTANGPLSRDLDVTFDLAGVDWVWGNSATNNGSVYHIDEAIAKGRYQDGVLQLNPVSLQSDSPEFSANPPAGVALATLNGEFSFDPEDPVDRTLRLEVSDVPISAVRQPLKLPTNFDGLMNVGASLTGTLVDPQVRGQLAVNQATINRKAIDLAAASFNYQDARLQLLGRMAIQEQIDPLVLVASVPLSLPGVKQEPDSDAVSINLRMRDEGFALINLLTQAITWEAGAASLDLAVQGRWPTNSSLQNAFTTLNVTGAANLDGVTISSRSLPEPLTNIRGNIKVVEWPETTTSRSVYTNGLVLNVEDLQGDFSSGKVAAQGNLTLLPSIPKTFPWLYDNGSNTTASNNGAPEPETSASDPLQITLDNIALDLRNPAGTYRGRVDGNVEVDGSVFLLAPQVYGQVQLSNGVLTLPEVDEPGATPVAFTSTAEPGIFAPIPPVFEDFQLVLAENVRLAIPGIVNVQAEGSLDLVGTVPDFKPSGRINLPSGRINLLTTEFRLSGNENYAEFSDLDETIDPYLVATLSALVPDSAATDTTLTVATPFPRNEISESIIDQLGLTQGGVQTVRIRATVNGRASRVVNLQDVELSSTPPRSEGEIITLVSGGFLAALESTLGSVSGGGDGFQGLLAFAGSALLNNLQSILGSGLDRTELRLYSATPPGGGTQQGEAIDLGGEVGFNFTPNISVSVQKVFTNVTPAYFSLRYRINDQISVRAITSYEQFSENTGAIVEFGF